MHKNENGKAGLNKQSGFTLIEALVVMIVGIVVLAAAAAGIGKLFRTSEIATEASNLTQLAANMRMLRNGGTGYKDLTTQLAIELKAVPANMSATATQVFNTWGGEVTIGVDDSNINAFKVVYPNVPSEACVQIAQKLAGAGWSSIKISGTEGEGSLVTKNASLADLKNWCGTDTQKTFTFVSSN